MGLQLILGGSGSGKSVWLYNHVISESIRNPQRSYIVIVPEQFTMATQRRLVMTHPSRGILNIDVLSFKRLALRVFEETGTDPGQVLTETGKDLLIRNAASRIKDQLKVMRARVDQAGYVGKIRSILSEFAQYNITDEDLDQMIRLSETKPMLRGKLQDIALIREACRSYDGGRFTTGEELPSLLADAARRSKMIAGSEICFDCFTGFTPVQLEAMRTILRCAPQVYVTVTIDPRLPLTGKEKPHELFALSRRTIRTLMELAQEEHVEILPPVVLSGEQGRFGAKPGSALARLERDLFRAHTGRDVPKEDSADTVQLISCENPEHEAREAAKEILRLVRQEGYRYREIAVVLGDVRTYERHLRRVLKETQIPYFMDQTRQIVMNPCIELIRAAMSAVREGMSVVSMLRMLRTGFFDITRDETDLLENYILAFGIRGASRWTEPWEKTSASFDGDYAAGCEICRQKIMRAFAPLRSALSSKTLTAGAATAALEEFLADLQVEEKLLALAQTMREGKDVQRAMEYEQIFAHLQALFEQVHTLLANEPITLPDYIRLIEAGCSEIKVGIIPPGVDEVQIGDMERTRLDQVRALLLLGVNDGLIPADESDSSIVTSFDRDFLAKAGITLAPDAREKSRLQRFYLYLCLTKPSEKLCLYFSRSGNDCKAKEPSYLIREVSALLQVPVQTRHAGEDGLRRILSPAMAMPVLAEALREMEENGRADESAMELLGMLSRDSDNKQKVQRLIDAAQQTETAQDLDAELTRRLYGSMLNTSVTRLELFAACPFSHFAKYGLLLRERERFEIRLPDFGNVMHEALALYMQELQSRHLSWKDVTDETQQAMVAGAVRKSVAHYAQALFSDTARNAYTLERVTRIVTRSVWGLTWQLRAGDFIPAGFETPFDPVTCPQTAVIQTGGGEKFTLCGRIDRTDLCTDGNNVYIKVIDYKSGGTKLDLTALREGLQLQLAVYMRCAAEMEQRIHPGKQIVPAGMLYYHLSDPIIDLPDQDEPVITEKLLAQLRPDGLVNGSPQILRKFDHETVKGRSNVIPVEFLAGSKDLPGKRSKIATPQQFQALSDFTGQKMQDLAERIMRGEAAPSPYRRADKSACAYCPYAGICGFDNGHGLRHWRRLKELSPEEFWSSL